MLGGLLKFTNAEQRAADFRRRSWRVGVWLWLPLFAIALLAAWGFAVAALLNHKPHAGYYVGVAISITASAVGLWLKRRY